MTHFHLPPQLECYEFLDLSDVDVRERDQLATALYTREGDESEDHHHQEEDREQELNRSQEEAAYWRNQQQGRYNNNNNNRKGRGAGLKGQNHPNNHHHQQFHERRDLVFGGHEQEEQLNNNNGSLVDSRPVSRTESVLTDISSSYLSSSASSLHVPNNAHQYPASVTSPPLLSNSSSCNGGGGQQSQIHHANPTYGEWRKICCYSYYWGQFNIYTQEVDCDPKGHLFIVSVSTMFGVHLNIDIKGI